MKRAFVSLTVAVALCGSARAQTNFWWTNTVDGVWNSSNWSNNLADATLPSVGGSTNYTINFVNAGNTYNTTNDLDSFLLTRLVFNNVAATLWGSNLVFVSNDATGPQITQTGASNVFINAGIVLSNNTAFSITSPSQMTLNGVISGPGGLTKSGSGTLTLANANTYTGLTIVDNSVNGWLILSNATGSGNAIGGNIQLGSGSTQSAYLRLAANEQIADTSIFSFGSTGFGRFNLLGYNETIGGLSDPIGVGLVENSDNTNFGPPADTNAGPSTLTISVGTSSNFVFAGYLRNRGSLAGLSNTLAVVKTGGGTQTFSGGNIGNGGLAGITVSNGFLVLTNTTAMSCGVTVNGGQLLLASVTAMGSTARDVTNNAANGLGFLSTNAFTIGGLQGSTSGSITLTNDTGAAVTLTVGGNNASGSYAGSLRGPGALAKTGSGTQTLSASNSYDGVTTISGGVLVAAHNNALGSTAAGTVVTSGSLRLTNGVTIAGETATLNGNGIDNFGALQAAANSTGTWAGAVLLNASRLGAGAGGVLIVTGVITNGASADLNISGGSGTGKVILSNTNTYTGVTGMLRGILALGVDNALPTNTTLDLQTTSVSDPSTFDLNGHSQTIGQLKNSATGALLTVTNSGVLGTLTVNQTANSTYAGLIGGNISLVKTGTFALTLTGTNTANGGVTLNAGTLNLNNTAVLGTGAFAINGGAIDNTTAAALTNSQNNAMNWNGDFTATATRSLHLGTGAVTLGSNRTVTVNANTLTIGGAIGDGGNSYSLTKAGVGTLVLASNATYTGATIINAGTLQLAGGLNPLSPFSAIIPNAGTLDLGGGTQFSTAAVAFVGGTIQNGTLSNDTAYTAQSGTIVVNLTGAAGLTKTTAGTLILDGTNSYTGGTLLNAGVLQINSLNALPAGTVNFTLLYGTTFAAGYAIDQAFLNFVTPASYGTVALAISSTNALDFNTPGLTNVSLGAVGGTRSYTGALTPFNSIYRLGGGGGTISLPNALSLTGANALVVSGAGVVSVSGSNSFSGGIIITNGGTLFIASDSHLGAVPGSFTPTNIVLNGGTLAGASVDINPVNANRGFAIGNNGGTLTSAVIIRYGGIISDLPGQTGTLYLASFGTAWVPSGNFTYSGGTVFLPGSIAAISGTNAVFGTGPITLLGGGIRTLGTPAAINIVSNTIILAANSTNPAAGGGTLTFTGPVILTNATRTLTVNQTVVIAGPISESSAGLGFTKDGPSRLILTGTNTYTGPTTVNAGTLTLGASALMTNTIRFELLSGGKLDVTAAGLALGVQELKGSGTVLGSVTAGSGAQITPGNSVGTLTITNNLTLQSGVIFNFELGATNASDKVIVNNVLSLDGMNTNWFVLSAVGGFGVGEYTLFDAASITGSLGSETNFANINGYTGYLWLDTAANDVKLTVVPEPGAGTLVVAGLLAMLLLRQTVLGSRSRNKTGT